MATTLRLPPESELPATFTAYPPGGRPRPLPRGDVELADGETVLADFGATELTAAQLAPLVEQRAIRSVGLGRTRFAPGGLAVLASLSGLERIIAHGVELTADDCALVAASPTLTSVTFLDVAVTDAHFAALATSLSVTSLGVDCPGTGTHITDAALEHAARMPALLRFALTRGDAVTGRGLDALAAVGRLVHLELSVATALEEPRVLPALERLRELRSVDLRWDPTLGDATCRALGTLPRLEGVTFSSNPKMTNAGLDALGAAPSLRWVHISRTKSQRKVTTAGVAAFEAAHPGVQVQRN